MPTVYPKMKQTNPKKPKSKPSPLNSAARYSGLAFQMIAIIIVGVWWGIKFLSLPNPPAAFSPLTMSCVNTEAICECIALPMYSFPDSNLGKIGLAISPFNHDVLYAAIELAQHNHTLYLLHQALRSRQVLCFGSMLLYLRQLLRA